MTRVWAKRPRLKKSFPELLIQRKVSGPAEGREPRTAARVLRKEEEDSNNGSHFCKHGR